MYDLTYYRDEILATATNDTTVLTGIDALVLNGVSVVPLSYPVLYTTKIEIDGIDVVGKIRYCFKDDLDTTNYILPNALVNNIFIPTVERAFIDLISDDLINIDEGYFLDALLMYIHSPEYNYPLLTEVAKHFNVPMETVDYWIGEAEDYAR